MRIKQTRQILPPLIRKLEKKRWGRWSLRSYRRLTSHRHQDRDRVLCVGYLKTGTTSLGRAMRLLGFSHFGYDQDLDSSAEKGDLERCLAFAAHFDSLDDQPWSRPEFVAAFRTRFPGSRYVLLERDEQEWLRSFLKFSRGVSCENTALAMLRNHQQQIQQVLADEPQVLRLNICAGEGFEKLCPFLGVEVPDVPFPWENRRSDDQDVKEVL